MDNWYYSKDGQQQGPVAQVKLQQMLQSGELTSSSLVWKQGMEDWVPASTVSDFKTVEEEIDSNGAGSAEGVTPYAPPVAPVHSPQGYQPPMAMGQKPNNYLVQSIILTVIIPIFTMIFCCCLPIPLGVVPLIYSCMVNSKYTAGDYAGSLRASAIAKGWCLGLWIVAGIFLLLFVVMIIAGGLDGLNQPRYNVDDF